MPAPDPQPDPQPQDQPIIFGKFDGYTNTIDRERLSERDLALALDIDLDDVGQAHRRRGRTLVAAGNFDSLFTADDGTVYGVKNGQLGIVRPDYSFSSLGVTTGSGKKIAYCQIKDNIYFSYNDGSGIISHSSGIVSPWGTADDFWYSPVVNPTANLPQVGGVLLNRPPFASALTYYNGRIYLAVDNMVWATEYFLYNYVNKTKNFLQFEGTITMLGAVSDGLYVGTTEGLYYLGGARFEELKRIRVMDSPVIPGSMVVIPAELANPPQVGPGVDTPLEVSLGFMTTRGFCVAEDSGKTTNLTESRVFFPVSRTAKAFYRRQDGMNHYIVCLDAGGDPLNGARFGDFVDAGIRRGNVYWVDMRECALATEKVT